MTLRGEAEVLSFIAVLLGRSHRMGHGDRTSYSTGGRPRTAPGPIGMDFPQLPPN